MSDNTQVISASAFPNGLGDVIATDDIDGVKYQRAKITIGADGVNDGDVSASNPMPVQIGANTLLASLIQTLIDEQRISNNLLRKIYQ